MKLYRCMVNSYQMSTTAVNTWDRQINEHDSAWTAFYRYRDLPLPRPPVRDFAAAIGQAPGRVAGWSMTYTWPSRLLAWDQHLDGRRQAVVETAVEEMARRHIGLAHAFQAIAVRAAEKIAEDLQNDLARMTPRDAIRIADVAVKMERLSRGEATERVEGTDYSKCSPEQLAALESIAKTLDGK
jgi:hypothetical protein